MSYWKILAGIGIGVGAVAAAPFTGGGSVLGGATLIASLTGAGAVTAAAAAAGGGIGYAMSSSDVQKKKSQEEKARTEDEQRKKSQEEKARTEWMKAGEAAASAKYRQKTSDLSERLAKNNAFERKVVGLFAVGIAVANADGHISDVEMKELDAFVLGISKGSLPDHVKNNIAQLRRCPPAFYPAITKARECGVTAKEIDDIVQLVAWADGIMSQEEIRFVKNWDTNKYQFN